jgi:hypothetical protein
MNIIKNCKSCGHFDFDYYDNDGDSIEEISFPFCALTYNITEEKDDNTYKNGFPFQVEQKCYVPGFWYYVDHDEELSAMFDEEITRTSLSDNEEDTNFNNTYKLFKERYLNDN